MYLSGLTILSFRVYNSPMKKSFTLLVVILCIALCIPATLLSACDNASLYSVELTLEDNILSWSSVEGADFYSLKIMYDERNGYEIPVYENSYKLAIYKAGSYACSVRAYVNSGYTEYSNVVTYSLERDINTTDSSDGSVTFIGSGTKEDPILIRTKKEFLAMGEGTNTVVENDISTTYQLYFKQMEDIDFNGEEVAPVATGKSRFKGFYDGNGYSIKNVKQTSPYGISAYTYIGVFGAIDGAKIINVTIENYTASLSYVGNSFSLGGLAGYAKESYIENCKVKGDININSPLRTTYLGYVGMLVGESSGNTVKACSVEGDIYLAFSRCYAGGIAGVTKSGTLDVLRNCRSTVNISTYATGRNGSTIEAIAYSGGLIGYASRFDSLDACWYSGVLSAQLVDGASADNRGVGLFGGGNAKESTGQSYLVYTNCYFDYEKLGLALDEEYDTLEKLANRYAIGGITQNQSTRTTVYTFGSEQMGDIDYYQGLDFESTWEIKEGTPVLKDYLAQFMEEE